MTAAELAARLPDVGTVREWARSLAALEAVVSPDWEYRYFSFDAAWGDGEQMASMRNGSGDDWSITFSPAGAYLRGFDHESALSPYAREPVGPCPGLLDGVPEQLQAAAHDVAWQLDGDAGTYAAFVTDYYERDIDLKPVEHVMARRPLTPAVARSLNARADWRSLAQELTQIGHPHDDTGRPGLARRSTTRWFRSGPQ